MKTDAALGFEDATDDVFGFNNERQDRPRQRWCADCGSHYRGDVCPCTRPVSLLEAQLLSPRRRRARRGDAPKPPEMIELRFRRFKRRRVPYEQYQRIMERDDWTCQYCGADGGQVEMGIDHVIPSIIGGSGRDDNLMASCTDCNSRKSDTIDAVRTFWRPEHYAEMIRVLIRERDAMQRAAVEMAREARERFGQQWHLRGVPEVLP